MELKVCNWCEAKQPVKEFRPRRNQCRTCDRKATRQYYRANTEQVKAASRAYYAENKDDLPDRTEYMQQWGEDNKERVAAYNKGYNARNKEQIAETHAAYYQENRPALLEAVKKRYRENPVPVKERVAKWQKANPEKIQQYGKLSRKRHPETGKRGWHARRARLLGASKVEDVDRLKVFEHDGWICQLCGKPIDREARPKSSLSASVDHIVPLLLGGTHTYENCQTAHFGCNCSKGHKHPEEWRKNHATDSEPDVVGD